MALKALLLHKRIDAKRAELETLRAKDAELETREAELAAAIEEITAETTQEDRDAVEAAVSDHEKEKEAHETAKAELEQEIGGLEEELAAEEAEQNTDPPGAAAPAADERKDEKIMEKRDTMRGASTRERLAGIVTQDTVKSYLGEVRTAIREKRAITNVGLTIPEVMLGLLRENVVNYSKLYRHVTVRSIRGEGRTLIMGAVPEAVWTECCANLNELTLGFNDMSVDCFKVAGYFAICNANLEDSDLDLAAEILSALGQAIGLALDKAILYGRNASTTQNMPQGIVSRLAQTEAPASYPATARPWADLHTTNILSIPAATKDAALFKQLILDSAAAKSNYARGAKTWVMNEATYTALTAAAMVIDAGGAIVAGVNGSMPVIGGTIEVLNFVPDNVIIGGYFDLYLLAERRGQQFATSEHVRFLQDQTVMKGTARYDGGPMIAEAFVVIGINGTTPNATMTFASDTAN